MSVNKYNPSTGNLKRYDGTMVDSTPTQNSGNPVSSGGVFTALDDCAHKFETVTFSDTKNVGAEETGYISKNANIPSGYSIVGATVHASHTDVFATYGGTDSSGNVYIFYHNFGSSARNGEVFYWQLILEKTS